ncbi:STP1 protein [Plasmodium ovale wallikeri]|uniref:STP1 protein n=1 Tax=Plasmodium ovale wallikeri TaxID=864142 RepID=A0A1A9ATN3_PLAOA|nr:STP1 protein [Plasmodium ovale wallikeri]
MNSECKNDNVCLIKKDNPGNSPVTTLTRGTQEQSNDQIQVPQASLSISASHDSALTPNMTGHTIYNNPQIPTNQVDPEIKRSVTQYPRQKNVISAASAKSGEIVNIPKVKTSSNTRDDSILRNNTNDNSNIIPEGFPPLTHIIPTLLVIMATITTFFLLYKYTPFGFLLGRKKKKKNLRRIIGIPEEPAYENIHKIAYEREGHNLGGQITENDIYIKLININRYKKAMKKKKKKKKITLIEVHIEVLEELKNNEWELHKDDFLEICLQGFIHKENDIYSNFTNSELSVNNVKNEKTIQDIEKQENLWNYWIENHRDILEKWKEEEWFQILKNEWKKEKQIYKNEIYNLGENVLKEPKYNSIYNQKDIWKMWISKQANHMEMFKQEEWFNSIINEQNKKKDNYGMKEYNNISNTSTIGLKNKNTHDELYRKKCIIEKVMVQIHMMVLEECVKEDIIKNKELYLDNFIQDINNQNNQAENQNLLEENNNDFTVFDSEEININID